MKLRTLLGYLETCVDDEYGSALLCVADEDDEEFSISSIDEDDNGNVILCTGYDADYCIDDIVDDLSDYPGTRNVYVRFGFDDEEELYNIRGDYYLDDDDDICFDIYGKSNHSGSKASDDSEPDTVSTPSYYEEALQGDADKGYTEAFNEGGFDGLWSVLKRFTYRLGLKPVYMALWLYYAISAVPAAIKATCVMALGYLIAPIDIISDLIPFLGLTDDIAVITAAVAMASKVLSDIEADGVSKKAKAKLRELFPDFKDSDLD